MQIDPVARLSDGTADDVASVSGSDGIWVACSHAALETETVSLRVLRGTEWGEPVRIAGAFRPALTRVGDAIVLAACVGFAPGGLNDRTAWRFAAVRGRCFQVALASATD